MAVIKLLAHRHCEAQTYRRDEILVLIAVENETVDKLDLVGTLVEIKSDREGQPVAAILSVVHSLHFHGAPYFSVLLESDFADSSRIAVAAFRCDKGGACCNLLPIHIHRLDYFLARSGNDHTDGPGVDGNRFRSLNGELLLGRLLCAFRFLLNLHKAGIVASCGYHGSDSHPFDGSVRPFCHSPPVGWNYVPAHLQLECGVRVYLAFFERNAEAHRLVELGSLAYPVQGSLAERLGVYVLVTEVLDGCPGQGGTESEPPLAIGFAVHIVEQQLRVNPVLDSSLRAHQLYVVPMVGLQKVSGVAVLFDDCGIRFSGVAAETGCGIVVAAETYIVQLHLGAVCKDSSSLLRSFED